MQDTSHLDALNLRLSHERSYLAAAKTDKERAIRKVWIAQIEREIAQEMAFLGRQTIDPEIANMRDDDLLAELGKE